MFENLIYYFRTLLKQPFKVGIITTNYPERENNRGDAIHAMYLSRGLAERGCEVHVFTRGDKRSLNREYIGHGLLVIHRLLSKFEFPIKDPLIEKKMSYFTFDYKVMNEIAIENAKRKFDIIHTHAWVTSGTFIMKNMNGLRWIHTFHAIERDRLKFLSKEEKRHQGINTWMESTISYADALISVSNFIKESVLKNYQIKENRVFVIPNGVDLKLFNNENNCERQERVLYIGRFALEKGVDYIPTIARIILENNPTVKFEIVSPDESCSSSLENTKKEFYELEKKYKDRFVWHKNTLNRIALANLYKSSMLLVQPSRYESFGMTILEAMSCGCTVICSNKGGIRELVDNAGILLPEKPKLFAKKSLDLLENYKLRERYARRGVERAKKFDWNIVLDKTLNIYSAISQNVPQDVKDVGIMIDNMEGKLSNVNNSQ